MRALLAASVAAIALGAGVVVHGAGAEQAAKGPRTIELTVRHSRFSAARLEAKPGETVRFVVTNTDPIDHELIVGDRIVQDRHELGTEARHAARPGEVTIPAGTARSTTYTFGSTDVLFGCHSPGHYAYGMQGAISVG